MEHILLAIGVVLLPALALSVVLLVSVWRISKHEFNEAKGLQGSREAVVEGRVESSMEIDNDPRVVEGMSRDKSGRYIRNSRLSDDYLKSLFGA